MLSKPLGTGILMTAFKRDRWPTEYYEAAVRWMRELNAATSRAMLAYDVHAATDITGFGLAGHGSKMANGSGVTLRIEESDLPVMPGALEMCARRDDPGRRRAQPRVLRSQCEDLRRSRRRNR